MRFSHSFFILHYLRLNMFPLHSIYLLLSASAGKNGEMLDANTLSEIQSNDVFYEKKHLHRGGNLWLSLWLGFLANTVFYMVKNTNFILF